MRPSLRTLCLLVALAACAPTVSDEDRATARIHYDIAVASLNSGDLRAALRELLAAVDKDPTLAHAHNALGLVYHGLGRPHDALPHYEKAVELNPKFSEAYNNLGVLLLELGRYDDAIAAFRVALDDILYATPSLAEGNMGWAYYMKGEVDTGLKHLRNAVATNPKFCRGYEWLARIGIEQNQPEQVIASCKRFQKYCAEDASIGPTLAPRYLRQMQYYLAIGYLKKGDRESARRALADCAVADPEDEFGSKCTQSLRSLQ